MAAVAATVGACVDSSAVTDITSSSAKVVLQGSNDISGAKWYVRYGPDAASLVMRTWNVGGNGIASGFACNGGVAADKTKANCFSTLTGLTADAAYAYEVVGVVAGVTAADCASQSGVMVIGECQIVVSSGSFRSAKAAAATAPANVNASFVHKGMLPNPVATTKQRDDGYSVKLGDKSVWVFGDTVNEHGYIFVGSTIQQVNLGSNYLTLAAQPASGFSGGRQLEALKFPAGEVAPAGYVRRHWINGPPVVNPLTGNAFVTYGRMNVAVPNIMLAESIAVDTLSPGANVSAGNPTVLFTAPERLFRPTGLVVGGYAFFNAFEKIGCYGVCTLRMFMARVPVTKVNVRSAFEFFDGTNWIKNDISKAASLKVPGTSTEQTFQSGQSTISFNAHLGKYLLVEQYFVSESVTLRVANSPMGPWSTGIQIQGKDATNDNNYFFIEHPEMARDNGKTIVLSYSTHDATNGLHIQTMEVTFP